MIAQHPAESYRTGAARKPPQRMDPERRQPCRTDGVPGNRGTSSNNWNKWAWGSVMSWKRGYCSGLPGGGAISVLSSISSGYRREESFSGNSATSPVSSLERQQPLLRRFLGEGNVVNISRPPGSVRPLLRRTDVPGELLVPFQGKPLVATAALVDRRVGLLQGPPVSHWPSPFCSGIRISRYHATHHSRSSTPRAIPLPPGNRKSPCGA